MFAAVNSGRLRFLLQLFEQALDPGGFFRTVVKLEGDLRRAPQTQPMRNFATNVARCGPQARKRLLLGLLAAQHRDQDARVSEIGAQLHSRDGGESDARSFRSSVIIRATSMRI